MGCDIHAVIEYRRNAKEAWFFHKRLGIDRNYQLFGLLAGVREDHYEPIVEPRGIPEDCSQRLKQALRLMEDGKLNYDDELYFCVGEHSHSYLTLKDFKNYNWTEFNQDLEKSITVEDAENGYDPITWTQSQLAEIIYELVTAPGVEARIVFGFDS